MYTKITYSSNVVCEFEDGSWTVVADIIERRFNGETWEEEKIAAKGISNLFEEAYQTAMRSSVAQFNDRLKKTKSGGLFPTPSRD
jgi:hypothetical protein